HNFIHKPFFRSRFANRLISLYQSVLLGIPQTLWRSRHLAHHAARAWKLRVTPSLVIESTLILLVWSILLTYAPRFFMAAYVPGYLAGLLLCQIQGHFEHARATVS